MPSLTNLTLADSRRLWELDQRCFPPGIAYSENEIRDVVRQGLRGFHAAVERDGKLVGFILSLGHGRRGHIITLDVAAEFRRQGIGFALMAAAERCYRERGFAGLQLEVAVENEAAHRFYTSFGFRSIRRLQDYYARGLDAWLMRKDWHPPMA